MVRRCSAVLPCMARHHLNFGLEPWVPGFLWRRLHRRHGVQSWKCVLGVRDPMELHAGRPADRPVNRRKSRSRGRFLPPPHILSPRLPRPAHWETETSPGDDGGGMQRWPSKMRVATTRARAIGSCGRWKKNKKNKLFSVPRREGERRNIPRGARGVDGPGRGWEWPR